MVFVGEVFGLDVVVGMFEEFVVGGLGVKKGFYVLFVLCGVGGGVGERMGGFKYGERDDFVILCVINVSIGFGLLSKLWYLISYVGF